MTTTAPDIVQVSADAWHEQGWDASATAVAAGVELSLASRRWQVAIDRRLRRFDLTFSRYEVLMRLLFTEPGSRGVAELGFLLQVHATSISNAVSRLEGSGYVSVSPNRRDGRRLDVVLTPLGRETALVATTVLNESVFARIPLDAGDVGTLMHVLARFRANAGDF